MIMFCDVIEPNSTSILFFRKISTQLHQPFMPEVLISYCEPLLQNKMILVVTWEAHFQLTFALPCIAASWFYIHFCDSQSLNSILPSFLLVWTASIVNMYVIKNYAVKCRESLGLGAFAISTTLETLPLMHEWRRTSALSKRLTSKLINNHL